MAKTTTITREYDREGRVVKETIVESGESNARDLIPPGNGWISPPNIGGGSTFPPYTYGGDIRPSSKWPTYTVNN